MVVFLEQSLVQMNGETQYATWADDYTNEGWNIVQSSLVM